MLAVATSLRRRAGAMLQMKHRGTANASTQRRGYSTNRRLNNIANEGVSLCVRASAAHARSNHSETSLRPGSGD
jgi:hypothetical protein